jgi:ectoine hydroxylase-related dioxygenase (phytanoyl-CoA dioxygenase family)
MPKRLTDAQVKSFRDDGALFPVAVLPAEAARAAREKLDALLHSKDTAALARDVLGYKTNLVLRWVDDIAHTPALLDIVEDLIGPDILLWSCTFAIKQPKSGGHFSWHQDATYWGLSPPVALTCWLAFGEVGPDNGGVRFLLGSHKLGILSHRNTFAADNFLSRGQTIAELPKACVESVARLHPGEISIHDALAAHSSGPNESAEPRIGCLLTFIPTFVRHERVRESAMLMRGFDRFGYHDDERRPSGDLLPTELDARAIAMRKMGTYQDESLLKANQQRS